MNTKPSITDSNPDKPRTTRLGPTQKTGRLKTSLLMAGVGNMLASTVIAGFLLGYFVDYLAGTLPLFLLLFGSLGFVGGIMKVKDLMIADAKRQQKQLLAQKAERKAQK